MKKLLAMGVIALFATNAFANVRIDDAGLSATGTDGSMQFLLEIQNSFVYKLVNDKADAVDQGTGPTQARDEAQDSLIDLGVIAGGMSAAVADGDCVHLTGLTQASALGVSATVDSETGLTPAADTASCLVSQAGTDVSLRMAIPMSSILQKAGAGSLDVAYSLAAPATGENAFQAFVLCDGKASANAPDLSVAPACASALSAHIGQIQGAVRSMYVVLEAQLAGSTAKDSYTQKVELELTVQP